MKRILAMAIVGVLSITSLAEANNVNIKKTKKAQKNSPSSKLYLPDCPDELVMIEDENAGGYFCISNVKPDANYTNASRNCEHESMVDFDMNLCSEAQWRLACEQKKDKLQMLNNGSEWVGGVTGSDQGAGLMIGSSCDSVTREALRFSRFSLGGSRCCSNTKLTF